jgi:hypothetical protein
MMRSIGVLLVALGAVAVTLPTASAGAATMPTYNHVFVIVEENHSYNQIIGDKNAPNINSWARTYSSATEYFGTIHPSEGNYVSMVGGDAYGIENDNLWTTNQVDQPNIVDQLERSGLSWKGYFENMPYPGYTGKFYDNELYAAKHNGFLNFVDINSNPGRLRRLVPFGPDFTADLAAGKAPNFSFILPNQCDDMHWLSQCPNDQTNIEVADSWAANTVGKIMASSAWGSGNNAIVVVWDEGTSNQGCCDAVPGGGQVPFIVITNHGPRGLQDTTAGNHYSMLATIQQVFGLGCMTSSGGRQMPVGFTCDNANVAPLSRMFAVSG